MTDDELIDILIDTDDGLSPTDGYQSAVTHVRALIAERNHYHRFAMMVGEIVRLVPEDIPSIDIETLLRDLPANVAAIVAERDRLRAIIDSTDGPVAKTMEYLGQAEAERDRLRAEKGHLVEVNAVLRTRPDLAERAPLVVALAEERGRLRAVVDAVRAMWDDLTGVDDAGTHMQFPTVPHYDAIDQGLDALGLLDGSGVAQRQRLWTENERMHDAARALVAAAKAWRSMMLTRPLPKDRERVVNAFADAIDAFDPMLSETTAPLDGSGVMGGSEEES